MAEKVYRMQLDAAELLAAASGACAKVTAVKLTGCFKDKYLLETSDAMDAGEVAAVEAALLAIHPHVVENA